MEDSASLWCTFDTYSFGGHALKRIGVGYFGFTQKIRILYVHPPLVHLNYEVNHRYDGYYMPQVETSSWS